MIEGKKHKSGFVNIIGEPNTGKSSLMNAMLGKKLSIVTPKAQTTRHRVFGILNGPDYQVVLSDTPGILVPRYRLHEGMMRFVKDAVEDADIFLLVAAADMLKEGYLPGKETAGPMISAIRSGRPVAALINKIDLLGRSDKLSMLATSFKNNLEKLARKKFPGEIIPVSALQQINLQKVSGFILKNLPESPPYFSKDTLTDKPEKFFIAELIREQIFLQYRKEIPYSSEVTVVTFRETENLVKISAEITVERETQKAILIGAGGKALKKTGTAARQTAEAFLGKKVFLELLVRVRESWRNNPALLKKFGYN